jgi:hypothetical protein
MNALPDRIHRDRAHLGRLLRNHKYERSPSGIRFASGLFIGGHAEVRVNDGPALIAPNLVTDEGINYLLSVGFLGGVGDSQWHIAPYSGVSSPTAGLTALTFAGSLTEFTNYSESQRPVWTTAATNKALSNTAAAALITVNAANQTVRGIAVMSVGTKSATSGVCLAAVPFPSARSGLNANDTLSLIYTLTGADDGV